MLYDVTLWNLFFENRDSGVKYFFYGETFSIHVIFCLSNLCLYVSHQGFVAPSFDDRMLEVVAVLGASQMGMSKVFGGMQHHRISQVGI